MNYSELKVPARLKENERIDFLKSNKDQIIEGITMRGQKNLKKTFMTILMEVILDDHFYMDRANEPTDSIDFENVMDEVSEMTSNKVFGYDNSEDKSSEFEMEQMMEDASKRQRSSSMR